MLPGIQAESPGKQCRLPGESLLVPGFLSENAFDEVHPGIGCRSIDDHRTCKDIPGWFITKLVIPIEPLHSDKAL